MFSRKLLCIQAGDDTQIAPALKSLSSWDVLTIDLHNLAAARKALKEHRYLVGLLLLMDARKSDLSELETLIESHQATQWVGAFPSEAHRQPMYRALILKHLYDFLTLPIDPVRLNHSLGHAYGFAELSAMPAPAESTESQTALIGQSAAMEHLRRQIRKMTHANAPVLIWGESGSGKELAARAIHASSPRARGPFVAVNCGAIPANLIQSELFGYERGAFTGAAREKQGLIESAAGGTLFLDEISDLPLELQTNLLRFLQEGTISRVGSTRSIEVDVRVIAASHTRVEDAVKAGKFREDLFYRLNVLPLKVPALRERKEDLELLANFFFKKFEADKSPRLRGIGKQAMAAIQAHDWPGNVRELINRIRRAMVLSEGRLITPQDLDLDKHPEPQGVELLDDIRSRAERTAIALCLQRTGNNVTKAARDLGVSRVTLYRLMKKEGLSP